MTCCVMNGHIMVHYAMILLVQYKCVHDNNNDNANDIW